MSTMQQQINSSVVAQKELIDNISRSSAQYATKVDLDAFAKQNGINLDAIQKDVASLHANISGMNQVIVNSQGQNQTGLSSTGVKTTTNPLPTPTVVCNGQDIQCPNTDPFGYQKSTQYYTLNEEFLPPGDSKNKAADPVPVGTVGFDASNAKPWSVQIYPRSYDLTNILATDQNGKQYVYNQFAITENGKSYNVPINTAKFVQQFPTPSFSFWNPRIFIGADGLFNTTHLKGEFSPSVDFGFISYGSSRVTPDWSFLQLGVGYGVVDKNLQVQLSPAQYNVGKHIPFMSNTYIGPDLTLSTDGSFMIGAGLRVGL